MVIFAMCSVIYAYRSKMLILSLPFKNFHTQKETNTKKTLEVEVSPKLLLYSIVRIINLFLVFEIRGYFTNIYYFSIGIGTSLFEVSK